MDSIRINSRSWRFEGGGGRSNAKAQMSKKKVQMSKSKCQIIDKEHRVTVHEHEQEIHVHGPRTQKTSTTHEHEHETRRASFSVPSASLTENGVHCPNARNED